MPGRLYTLVTLTYFSISHQIGVASRVYEHIALPLEMLDLTQIAAIYKVRGYIFLRCKSYVMICPYELCKVE